MSEQNVQSSMKKFIDCFNAGNTEDEIRTPLKDMFEQIKGDLESLHDAITRHKYSLKEEDTDSIKESVDNLNELLKKSLALSKKLRSSSNICLNYYSPADWVFLAKTREKLQKIMPVLNEKRVEADMYLMENPIFKRTPEPTTGDVDETKIFGWDEDADKIITESLIKENENGLNVVGIIGMFGTGKTTLAQKIFMSEKVMDHFPLRLWVWVSKDCDKEELLRRILDSLGVEEDHIEEMLKIDPNLEKVGVLLFLVHLELLRKRYLIVFDDVVNVEEPWHCKLDEEPPEDKEWTNRLAYGLPKGDGSAIIITSRKEDDARKMVGAGAVYTPKPLIGDDGWTLFKTSYKRVANMTSDDKNLENLENLRKHITEKCGGLPIALKAAGEKMAKAEQQKEEDAIKAESSSKPNV